MSLKSTQSTCIEHGILSTCSEPKDQSTQSTYSELKVHNVYVANLKSTQGT